MTRQALLSSTHRPLSRRTICATLLASFLTPARRAAAIPTVSVGAPRVERAGTCLATVTVRVVLADLDDEATYRVGGELLEFDNTLEDADFCGFLPPRTLAPGHTTATAVQLTQTLPTAQVGMVRGFGPASDETGSRDLVEVFARVWVQDLDTGEDLGVWDSPQRVLVSSAGWPQRPPGGIRPPDLMLPRQSRILSPSPAETPATLGHDACVERA